MTQCETCEHFYEDNSEYDYCHMCQMLIHDCYKPKQKEKGRRTGMKEFIVPANEFEEEIARTAGYKELIRCKDCKKRNTWECWQYFFGRMNLPDDYYCADGKPKDGEQE